MLYNALKIAHILSASGLLTGMVLGIRKWFLAHGTIRPIQFLSAQTALLIVPLALFQLLTGYTMIGLNHLSLNDLWIKGSLFGFVIVIACWMGFIGLGFQSKDNKHLQIVLLAICFLSLLVMIFLMVNKIL